MNIIEILNGIKNEDHRIHGLTIGLVSNTKDPDGMGRVKVKFPRISAADESDWARVAAPMAGKDRGVFFPFEVDDEVLVGFEHGDICKPYILGALRNGKDTPPEKNEDGKNEIRMIKSRSGHIVRFTDKSGEEKIEIIAKGEKHKIEIDVKGDKITIEATDGAMDITAGGDLKITGTGSITMASDGDITIKPGGALNLKATGAVTVKGSAINLN